MVDTCQANTMYTKFRSPEIVATGSSELGQSSYSHHADQDIGVAVIDRYTHFNLEYLENKVTNQSSKLSLGDLFGSYDEREIHSKPGIRYDLVTGGADAAQSKSLMDFFGAQAKVQLDTKGPDSTLSIRDINVLAAATPNEVVKSERITRPPHDRGVPKAPAGLQKLKSGSAVLMIAIGAIIALALLMPAVVWASLVTTVQSLPVEDVPKASVRLARNDKMAKLEKKAPIEVMVMSNGHTRAA
jgi:glycosylphosphatidylinositol transamidase (GPIT) subunit GPI8